MSYEEECADIVIIAKFEGVQWSRSFIPLKTEARHVNRLVFLTCVSSSNFDIEFYRKLIQR